MREVGEVEPGKGREADEVLHGGAFEVEPGACAFDGGQSGLVLLDDGGLVGEGCEADGVIGAGDNAASVNELIAPDGSIDDAQAKVFDQHGGGKGSLQEGDKDGDAVGAGVETGGRAIEAQTDAMKGLGEGREKFVDRFAGPCGHVDGRAEVIEGGGHGFILRPGACGS